MDFRLPAPACTSNPSFAVVIDSRSFIRCLASKRRGFGPESTDNEKSNKKTSKENMGAVSKSSKLVSGRRNTGPQRTPQFASVIDPTPKNTALNSDFLKKVEAVRRSALDQKKTEEKETSQAIDYDVPLETEQSTIGLGTKVGIGLAVVVFGLVFALGDFIPSGSIGPSDDAPTIDKKLTGEEKATLQSTLQQYEETLGKSPNDATALEASNNIDLDVLRGLTNSLLAAKKPDEAVQVLLSSRERLSDRNKNGLADSMDTSSDTDQKTQKIDPIQVELLLGKSYSDWGHVSDAITVYDQLISKHPDDFRGYLAKGIILKENGKVGEAERMFIQARFFAPEPAKPLVDRYARR